MKYAVYPHGIPVSYKYWDEFWNGYKTIHSGTVVDGQFKAHPSFGNFSCRVEDLPRWKEGEERGYLYR